MTCFLHTLKLKIFISCWLNISVQHFLPAKMSTNNAKANLRNNAKDICGRRWAWAQNTCSNVSSLNGSLSVCNMQLLIKHYKQQNTVTKTTKVIAKRNETKCTQQSWLKEAKFIKCVWLQVILRAFAATRPPWLPYFRH